ncbi:arylesterase [Tropicimonas sp. IMCC34043]|uniref:arylesterase n=1 Tax=Tropicimonas sp. IMCC34043 TaxID=2248760 RepID=UPI001E3C04E1|nr:arylesterase [Tropicimonas sp. IMCC34043]
MATAVACLGIWGIGLSSALPASAEPITLVAFGDSLTQGYGLPDGEGLVPQLQSWLRDRGHDVVLVNAGVSGDTTAGGLSRIEWTLTPEVQGMIVALGGNDMLRGIDPAVSRANLDGILTATEARGVEVLLVGMEAPGNYGPDYKAAFDAIFPDLAAAHHTLYAESFLSGLSDQPDRETLAQTYLQPDGLHPNPAGVALMVRSLGPQVEALLARIDAAPPASQ